MRIHAMVAAGAISLLPALCTASCVQSPDAVDTPWTDACGPDEVVVSEEHGSRGVCEDACEKTAERWARFCSTLRVLRIISQCLREKNEGAGYCYRECRNGCHKACTAINRRWELYCEERAPRESELACEVNRGLAVSACHKMCKGRSLDVAHRGDTVDG
jgi:hypothetical protein